MNWNNIICSFFLLFSHFYHYLFFWTSTFLLQVPKNSSRWSCVFPSSCLKRKENLSPTPKVKIISFLLSNSGYVHYIFSITVIRKMLCIYWFYFEFLSQSPSGMVYRLIMFGLLWPNTSSSGCSQLSWIAVTIGKSAFCFCFFFCLFFYFVFIFFGKVYS